MQNLLINNIINLAILEDIGIGDITSTLTIPENSEVKAHIIAKERLILAGMPFAIEVFNAIDRKIKIDVFHEEGSVLESGDIVAEVSGKAKGILAAERIALNILQRISGIASLTNTYVNKVKEFPVKIADTRKTTPGMRIMEKYGVKIGGGVNHRYGLYDGILIKDNHIKIVGSIKRAVELARRSHHLLKIEVEVKNLKEFNEALESGADVIMLDNMSLEDIREAVRLAKGKVILEVSGNVNLDNVVSIAETGVDIISIGSLTHSARAVDISMKII